MSAIDVKVSSAGAPRRRRRVSSARQTPINRNVATALLVLLVLVPLPFGSVHGFAWGLFAAYVGAVALLYVFALRRAGEAFRYPLDGIGLPALLYCGFIAYLVVQMLPVGLLIGPLQFGEAESGVLAGNTISIASDMTLLMLMRQVTYGAFFFLVLQVTINGDRRRQFLNLLLAIICAYALLGIISLNTGDTVLGLSKTAYPGSATGPFVNRNSFATFLGLGAVIALAQMSRRLIDRLERHVNDGHVTGGASTIVLYGIAYLLLLAVIVATQSRMGLLATAIASLAVLMLAATRTGRGRILALVALVFCVAAAAGALYLYGDALFERIFDIENASTIRTDLYLQVLQLVGQRPLLGFGGGSFEVAFPLVHAAPVTADVLWDRAHNSYLALWSELGLVAGSVPILLGVLAAIGMARSVLKARGNWEAQAAALGALLLVGLHSATDFSLEIQANAFFLLAVTGIGLAAAGADRRDD